MGGAWRSQVYPLVSYLTLAVASRAAAEPEPAAASHARNAPPAAPPRVELDDLPPMPVARNRAGAQVAEVADQTSELIATSVAKRVQSVQESPLIVTVLTRKQIIERGYRTVAELLDDLPGFEGLRSSFDLGDGTEDPLARGGRRTVLVLWNGTPVNTPNSNDATIISLGGLPIHVDRVEVVSGPGGVLWGANAYLGVVSITSLRPAGVTPSIEGRLIAGDGPGWKQTLAAGAYGSASLWRGKLDLLLAAEVLSTRDTSVDVLYDLYFSPFNQPQPDAAHALRTSSGPTESDRDLYVPLFLTMDVGDLQLDLYYELVRRDLNEFVFGMVRSDHVVRPTGETIDGQSHGNDNYTGLAALSYQARIGNTTDLTLRGHYTSYSGGGRVIGLPAGYVSDEPIYSVLSYRGEIPVLRDGASRTGVNVDLSHVGLAGHYLLGGAEMRLEVARALEQRTEGAVIRPATLTQNHGRRLVLSAFAHDQVQLGSRVQGSLGVRGQVAPGSYRALVLASAALAWNPLGALYLKLNAAQGFRPPPFELTHPNDDPISNPLPHNQGNPDLRGERSQSLEGELSLLALRDSPSFDFLVLRTSYQLTVLTDQITRRDGIPVNSARRVIHGAEMRLTAELRAGHRFGVAYGFHLQVDDEFGPLRHLANHKFNVDSRVQLQRHLAALARATFYGKREDYNRLPIPTGMDRFVAPAGSVIHDSLPPTATLHLALLLGELAGGRLDLALHLDNLLDARPVLPDSIADKRFNPFPIVGAGFSAYAMVTGRL
jgi:outer membrane receptor for ferrienterochelin and colicin